MISVITFNSVSLGIGLSNALQIHASYICTKKVNKARLKVEHGLIA